MKLFVCVIVAFVASAASAEETLIIDNYTSAVRINSTQKQSVFATHADRIRELVSEHYKKRGQPLVGKAQTFISGNCSLFPCHWKKIVI
jgi:hypothetical protein